MSLTAEGLDVTVDEVRTALSEIDASALSDAVISAAIDDEEIIVEGQLPDDWASQLDTADSDITSDRVELLWKRRAAREAFHRSPMVVRQQALDAVVSYDIQAFRGRLNDRVADAYEILGLPREGGGEFVEVTRHLGGNDT